MAELCYKCFREYESGGVCPHCGYSVADDAGKYPHALKAGSVLGGRYIVGRVLGQGGFGITYMAQDYDTKQLIAIKEYLPEQYATRIDHSRVGIFSAQYEKDFLYGMENFLQEAKTISQFNGIDNICDIYSYFEENGTAYFAMEYVEGIGLDKHLKNSGALSFEDALGLLLPVMEALAAVHSKGIIHRDISPDNIMIRADGRAMLIDFGAARYSMGEKSRSLDVILKHGFAPKEQYTRHGRQGAYTDVYAMAATFYYAITGKLPPDAIDRLENDRLELPSKLGVKISRHGENALSKALSCLPEDRFQTMADFTNAISGKEKPEKTPRAKPDKSAGKSPDNAAGAKPEKPGKGKRGLAVLLLVLALLAGGAFALTKSPLWDLAQGAAYYYGVVVERDYELAMEKCLLASERDNGIAQMLIGFMYHNGDGVEQDYHKAREYYEMAVSNGDIMAINNLGVMYNHGEGVEQDYAKALEHYIRAASLGNAMAMRNIGSMYEWGKGVNANYSVATEWYMTAARHGYDSGESGEAAMALQTFTAWLKNSSSQIDWTEQAKENGYEDVLYDIACMYENGKGTRQNYFRAAEWYELAGYMGHTEALNRLGLLYSNGQGVEQEDKTAVYYYSQAANLGDPGAMYNLGKAYYMGMGVDKNFKEAKKWLEEASQQGEAGAKTYLGLMYLNGLGVEQSDSTASDYFFEAAGDEDPYGMYCFALCFRDAIARKTDMSTAVKWFERAAALEFAEAEMALGEIYENGAGVAADYTKAREYYKEAMDHGSAEAAYRLGEMFYNSYDYQSAVSLYKKAADAEHAEAMYRLAQMHWYGQGVTADRENAIEWYIKSAEQGNTEAMLELASCYEDGNATEQDYSQALYWYKMAEKSGRSDLSADIQRLEEKIS